MEGGRRFQAILMGFLLVGLLSESFVTMVMSREFAEQKNYYPPDPHSQSPPKHSHRSPPSCSNPPHGGGGSYGTSPPSYGTSPPSYGTSSPPVITTPPSPAIDPGTQAPPFIPIPTPPFIPIPTPPFIPSTPPIITGTCTYWLMNPGAIFGLFGYFSTVARAFGFPAVTAFGRNPSLQEALANTRTDGIGSLYREGTASLLNSMANRRFAFTTEQVRVAFTAAMVNDRAARAQAQLFKQANEGHLKH